MKKITYILALLFTGILSAQTIGKGSNTLTGVGSDITKTSDLTNDGDDGVNPFISANDVPDVDEISITSENDTLKLLDRSSNIEGQRGYKRPLPDFNWSDIPSTYANSIIEIRYDYDLGTDTITLPENVTLKFEGGIIKNGAVTGNNTLIKTENTQIFEDIEFLGSFKNKFFNPVWCGAVGDGVTDDTNAFKATVFSTITLNVEIPEGTYLISEKIEVKSNTILKGHNATLKLDTSGITFFSASARENVTIEGISFEGTSTVEVPEILLYVGGSTDITVKNCTFSDSVLAVFAGDGTTNATVENCKFYDIVGTPGESEGYGVLLNGDSYGAIVQNNHFERVQRHCVYLSGGSTNCLINNNVMTDLYGSAININGGVSFSVNPVQNCIISNNVITNVSDNGSGQAKGIGTSGVFNNCIIKGNTIRNTEDSGFSMASDGVPTDNLIDGNTFYNVASGVGEDAIVLIGTRNVFSNNIIYSDNSDLNRGIYVTESLDCIISGGQTYFNARFSVSANSSSNTGLTITNIVEQSGAGFSFAAAINTKGFYFRGDSRTDIP